MQFVMAVSFDIILKGAFTLDIYASMALSLACLSQYP